MKRRIFIAINFPETVKKELFDLTKKWPALPCRWVKKDNLHLTLAFLAYLNEDRLNLVLETIKEVAEKNESFVINLTKVGYGPEKMIPPRLVWAKGERSEELLKLKKDLDEALVERINFAPEKREFLLHITLGRVKGWDWRKIEPEERPNVNLEISLEIPVNSVEIMESHLKRSGAEYKVLESFRLRV